MIAGRPCYGRLLGPVMSLVLIIHLSACATPTQPTSPPTAAPTTQSPAGPPPVDLQLAHLQQAAYNYARYHALAPDDLLGLKHLAGVCAALEQAGVEDPIRHSPFAICNLHEELEARTDDRRIVAELPGVPVEKADSHLPHIASLTRQHVCPVE